MRRLLRISAVLGLLFAGCDSQEPPAVTEGQVVADTDPAAVAYLGDATDAPRSLLAHPTYLSDEPPEGRAIAQIRLVWAGAPGVSVTVERSFEETAKLAEEISAALHASEGDASFADYARSYSADESARFGGVWGTVTPGTLSKPIDDWIFRAEIGDVSEPIKLSSGFMLLKRVDRLAGCRTLLVSGTDDASRGRCEDLRARISAGESFEALAREHSDDPLTRERGGALAIFERGRRDTLLKGTVFTLPAGDVSQPVLSPLGWHLVQRVEPESLDPALREVTMIRGRAILVQYAGAFAAFDAVRTNEQALERLSGVRERILAGEDMAALALAVSEDPGSAPRGGDLGWLHRGSVQVPNFMDRLFQAEVGELLDPIDTTAGWVLLRREQ